MQLKRLKAKIIEMSVSLVALSFRKETIWLDLSWRISNLKKKKELFWPGSVRIGLLQRYVRDPFPAAGSDRYVALRAQLHFRAACDAFAAVGIVLFGRFVAPLQTSASASSGVVGICQA